jgi:hypothetical protein
MEAGYYETAIAMDPDQQKAVREVTSACLSANAELLRKGNRSFLGAATWVCMGYPDMPFGWKHRDDLVDSWQKDGHGGFPNHLPPVGYYEAKKGDARSYENWVGVIDPPSLPQDRVYPKEQALLDICAMQHKERRQTWVYVTMTGKQDIQPRLKILLETKLGLRVGILRADTVAPIDRERWIEENGMDYDVIISNAELVKTGLDLFSPKQGGHNFSTLVFYETGYNQFTLLQASRRAWRIGQNLSCRVYYLWYKGTAQETTMRTMSRKLSASQSLEGNFDADGLASMAIDDNLQLEVMKALADGVDSDSVQRSWQRCKSN